VDKASDLAGGEVLSAVRLGADGRAPQGVYGVWTGSDSPAHLATENCLDWSSSSITRNGASGAINYTGTDWFANGADRCDGIRNAGVYCFQR
jgi:hypothetical protein